VSGARAWLVWVGAGLAACGGEVGTIQVEVVASPGSDLLERVERVRAELSDPPTVVEAERDGDGRLAVDFEFPAENAAAEITLEGFDADGELIAVARSAPLPVAAVNASLTVFLAPPVSITEAPVALEPARSEIGAALLPYGAILMGGRDADGAAMADVAIYNVYDHDFQAGLPLPESRAAATVVSGASDRVYLFGGLDADGSASADGWAFNTAVAPAGADSTRVSDGDLARAGAAGVFVLSEQFLITGAPAVQVDGIGGRVIEWPDAPPLVDGVAVRLGDPDDDEAGVLVVGSGVGESGAVGFRANAYRELDAPAEARRTGHAVVALPEGRALVVGGAIDEVPARSAVVYDDDDLTVRDDLLAVGRLDAAVAASPEYVLVAGGTDGDGAVLADAELFDAATLEPVATLPLVAPRRGARALVLANGQILIAGGLDAGGAPVALLELFTPGPR
jgi:hypothetical protein